MKRRIQPSSYPVSLVAGVDEAGRGCLAGPVYAAAVILDPGHGIRGLEDSKKLKAAERDALFDKIQRRARAFAIARAELHEIETLNILHASMLAMQRAVSQLQPTPQLCLIDGNRLPRDLPCPGQAVVGGDGLHAAIMAASILAKVARDREMQRLDVEYPGYGFARHKGYGTPDHLSALRRLGLSPLHRLGFAPCQPSLFDSALPLSADVTA
ncbi:RNase HII [Hydrocarboniphaga daqingensis]|uniref:Ribonuclease HII n=1 Tax=Hydrocarboniphaga daqingensis TaxID=490188 RepID=A0A1M5Q1H7_9GAMM|nr:ribonuclease HII [Hydrocarboniphaga daqingensis]SHH07898.1 RNase HII [Hydrocarboniphaga daqingensis]